MKNLINLLLCFILVSCDQKNNRADLLVVGTCGDNPPFEFIQNGQLVGFDVDLANLLANELGKKLVIKNMSFQGLLPALSSGSVDVLIAGLSNTAQRQQSVDFSDSYAETSMSILTNENLILTDLGQLKGKIIGAQMGSAWHQEAKKIQGNVQDVKLRLLLNNLLLINELMLGKIDALVVESSQVQKFRNVHYQIRSFEIADSKSILSIAVAKNSKLKKPLDKAVLRLKNSGAIALLSKKWFN